MIQAGYPIAPENLSPRRSIAGDLAYWEDPTLIEQALRQAEGR